MSETYLSFDPSLYLRLPVLSLPTALSLGRALVEARSALSSGRTPDAVRRSVERLEAAMAGAQEAWATRQREERELSEADTRAIDQQADRAWGALRMRLSAWTALPAEEHPEVNRAAELMRTLFGEEGLAFLTSSYPVQWSTMEVLHHRIESEGLAGVLEELCGAAFVGYLRSTHTRYGQMMQAILRREGGSEVNLSEELRKVSRALVDYASKTVALVDPEDPESVKQVKAMLRPILEMRSGQSARTGATEGAEAAPVGMAPESSAGSSDGAASVEEAASPEGDAAS